MDEEADVIAMTKPPAEWARAADPPRIDDDAASPWLVDDLGSRFVAGDDAALRDVYDVHGSLIYSICRRTVGPDRAADVTQEVFISAWRSRDRFDPRRGTMAGWLVGIAKHRCVDALRKDGRRPSVVGIEDDIGTDVADDDAIDSATRVIDRMLLAECLTELSDRARRCVELAFLHDLTHGEIADRTGVPLGTVKSDIRRGLAHLRRHLEASNA